MSHNFNLITFVIKQILYIQMVKLCHDMNYMWWGNQELELHEWEDFRKSKKTRILAIFMLVPNKNTPR